MENSVDFSWINKSNVTVVAAAKHSIFIKAFADLVFNGVGVRNEQAAPKITKRSIPPSYLPWSLFPVSVDNWP